MQHIHTHNGIQSSLKKEVLSHGTTWMNLEDMLSVTSQSQKKKYCMLPLK